MNAHPVYRLTEDEIERWTQRWCRRCVHNDPIDDLDQCTDFAVVFAGVGVDFVKRVPSGLTCDRFATAPPASIEPDPNQGSLFGGT